MERTILIEKARQVINQTQEVRQERVAALKEALDKRTYQVDSRKLANAFVDEMLR